VTKKGKEKLDEKKINNWDVPLGPGIMLGGKEPHVNFFCVLIFFFLLFYVWRIIQFNELRKAWKKRQRVTLTYSDSITVIE